MNGVLNVDTAKLTSTASAFSSTANAVQNLTNQMTETVNQLTGQVWSGDAASKYVSQFNGLRDDIERVIKMINEHVDDLQQMAANYEQAESSNASAASSLSADVIV